MLSEQQIAELAAKTHVAEHHYGNTWSATVYFGEGDEARDAMRLFADAVRTGQLVAVSDDAIERVALQRTIDRLHREAEVMREKLTAALAAKGTGNE